MKHIARILLAALMLALITVPASAESFRVYVSANTLKCYASNSTSAAVIGTLGYGEAVTCLAYDDSWAVVEANGVKACCKVDGLTTKNPNYGELTAYVAEGGAKAHTRPGSSYKSAEIPGGTKLTVVAMTSDKEWCRVYKSGSYAYMKTRDLTTAKPSAETSSSPSKSVTAYIGDETVTIYSSASASSGRVAYAAYGEKVNCVAIDGSWAKIEYEGKTGWCYTKKLMTEDPNTYSTTVYAERSGVAVYSHPSASSGAIATMSKGDSITAVCVTPDGCWLRVTASGRYGYVRKSSMSLTQPKSQVDELIDLAMAQLGKPYVYATRGTRSFDCSGFTLYCFREIAGITLGRSAQSQGYNNKYTRIDSYTDLKRGDIVCFNTVEEDTDMTDHVGIYLGNGQFIHASSVAGKVIISDMSSGYYRRQFTWARRLIY